MRGSGVAGRSPSTPTHLPVLCRSEANTKGAPLSLPGVCRDIRCPGRQESTGLGEGETYYVETKLSANQNSSAAATQPAGSRWGAFGYAAFTVIWTASLVSNVGTAMFDTASGWLITSLDANPTTVSLVQVAVSLPLFLFTLPAGALADVIDSRRLLIAVELAILAVSVIFAGLVSLKLETPTLLLATTFLLGVGGALTSPAWGSTIPLLVPKEDLDSATALNGVGFNIGRAAGPALGGLVIAAFGVAVPFWIFAASNIGIVAALIWWRKPRNAAESLPAERLVSAVRAGVRHVANNPYLRATLIRVLAFFPFASAYFALLSLVARDQISGGPQVYGILLGAIGVGAVGGSLALRWLKEELGPDRLVATGSVGAALALILFGLCARAHYGDLRVPRRRRVVDCSANEALCIGAGRAAGLGARPWARCVPDFHLRSDDRRQRGMGETLCRGGAADRLFRRGCGRGSRDSADLALETSDRRRNRLFPRSALARAHGRPKDRE